jgi:hypothetical protein
MITGWPEAEERAHFRIREYDGISYHPRSFPASVGSL